MRALLAAAVIVALSGSAAGAHPPRTRAASARHILRTPHLYMPAAIDYSSLYALDLDGTDSEYLSVSDTNALDATTALSVACWVYYSTIKDQSVIVAKWGAPAQKSWVFDTGTDDRTLRFVGAGALDGSSTGIAKTSNLYLLGTGAWFHAAATYNAGSVVLYLNGRAQAQSTSGSMPASLLNASSAVEIAGYSTASGFNHSGWTDDCALWVGTVLTANQVATMWNGGTPQAAALSPTPTARWRMGEDGWATEVSDIISGFDAAPQGMESADRVTTIAVPLATNTTSIDVDGAAEYVLRADSAALSPSSKFTIICAAKPDVVTGSQTVAGKWAASNQASWAMQSNAAKMRCYVSPDCNSTTGWAVGETSSNVLSLSTWGVHACVYDGTQTGDADRLKLYVDAQPQTLAFTGAVPATVCDSTANYTVGAIDIGFHWDGRIDECVYYVGVALTQDEISTAFAGTRATGVPNTPTVRWRFDGDSTASVADHSGNGYTGTPQLMESGDFVADAP